MRDRSASETSRSRTSGGPVPSASVGRTTSAACSASNVPSKTPSSWSVRWSSGSEQVVAPLDRTFERPLPCGASRGPDPGSGRWDASRSRMARSGMSDRRAAASSMPSGRPSSSSQISVTSGASAPGSQSWRTARARSDEQFGRRVRAGRRSPQTAVHRQRANRVFLLPGDVERGAARDDEAGSGRGAHEGRDVPGRLEEVLEVVEDEQEHRTPGEEPRQRVDGRAARRRRTARGSGR